jgi:hypothetical protein
VSDPTYAHKPSDPVQVLAPHLPLSKGVIRIFKSEKDRQHNAQKKKRHRDKQQSTKHYSENKRRIEGHLFASSGIWSIRKLLNKKTYVAFDRIWRDELWKN